MFNVKVLLLAFLLLATNVLAVRVTYSAKFTGQKVGERTSKLATVEDDKGTQIIEKMATWSNGKYTAARSASAAVNMINVVNAVEAPSKGAASDMVQEMQTIVANNYKPKSRSPSPHKVRRSPRPARRLKARSPRLARQY
jgi:hypothetical protein